MADSRRFFSILIPSVTVFVSSFCIMVLELVASRLIARHLGASLYTWTSVIGVVLAGITIGNYLGGRIADRYPAKRALAVIFAVASAACVAIVILNNVVGSWVFLWRFSWPLRVFCHVSLVFLVPSALLGMISPVVAKMALDVALPTGRTVGDIYAWGAAGSIAGTFAAGYYLIAAMGTIALIWSVGAALLLMAILYQARLWILYVWAAIFVVLFAMGMAPAEWAREGGAMFGLRGKPNPSVIYEDETPYCYVWVKRISPSPDSRLFIQDKLDHSKIVMGDIDRLMYPYTRIYAGIMQGLCCDKDRISAMLIGGGGYVFPRYIEKHWPGSRIDVVEIDPGVTEAAIQAFGLERNATINTFIMDARNYVDELTEKNRNGHEIRLYDFVFGDAFNDYSVPYQLVTKEFNDKIYKILADDGVYLLNVIDIYDSGKFIGAMVGTLQQTFPYVYILSDRSPRHKRHTFVLAATKQETNPKEMVGQYDKEMDIRQLERDEIAALKGKSGGIVFTDDYAPVENLLAPVVRQSSVDFLELRYHKMAEQLLNERRFEECLKIYEKIIKLNPSGSATAHNDMGIILMGLGRYGEAIGHLKKAVELAPEQWFGNELAGTYLNLGMALKKMGVAAEAGRHISKAAELYRRALAATPNSAVLYAQLGIALAENGDFKQAGEAFATAVDIDPADPAIRMKLAQSLQVQGRIDDAIAVLQKGVDLAGRNNDTQALTGFQKYIEYLRFRKRPGQ